MNSFVEVLREQDGVLRSIGITPGLAQRERLKSVRFEGDRGYVVTFLQVDPLFTLDLSDPEHPSVLGALKIPGYSSYIHPLSSARLLGIGRDGSALQVSLFDVTDPLHVLPMTVHQFPGEYSEAEYEHLAFQLAPDGKRLAIPVMGSCAWSQCRSGGLRTFQLDPVKGLVPEIFYHLEDDTVRRVVFLNGFMFVVNANSLHVISSVTGGDPLAVIPLP